VWSENGTAVGPGFRRGRFPGTIAIGLWTRGQRGLDMPAYLIRGADRASGGDTTITVEASDEREAGEIASREGVLVASMERLPPPVGASLPVARVVGEARPARRRDPHEAELAPEPVRELRPRLQQGHVRGAPVVNVAMPRRGNSSAVASLVLGIVAFLICWVPLLGLISVPLSGLGVLLAGVGFLVALTRAGAGIGYALGGGVVSGLALFVTISMTGAIVGGVDALEEARAEASRAIAAAERGEPASTAAGATEPEPAAETWAIARLPVRVGDVELTFPSVRVGRVPIVDAIAGESFSREDLLAIEVEVRNFSGTRKVEYRTWSKADAYYEATAELIDGFGNSYPARAPSSYTARIAGATASGSVYPGGTLRDVLVFDPPVDAAEYLHLRLEGARVGVDGEFRVMIPTAMIER